MSEMYLNPSSYSELQVVLETQKLSTLNMMILGKEHIVELESIRTSIEEQISDKILESMMNEPTDKMLMLFKNTAELLCDNERFKKEVKIITNRFIRKRNRIINEAERKIGSPPASIINLVTTMDEGIGGLMKPQDYHRKFFISQYLVYKLNEEKFIFDSRKINKTELYNMVFGLKGTDTKILEKINDVQRNHKLVFKKEIEDINYEAAKKIMNQVIQSEHRDNTMNQSEDLNVFQQQALLIKFLIHKTSYQSFLSSKNRKVPDIVIFEEVKKAIETFLKSQPISGVDDELFLKTVREDTYHFALFNAITKLTTKIFAVMNQIIDISSKNDIILALFIIDEMIKSTPNYVAELLDKYEILIKELNKATTISEVKQAAYDAIEDEEALKYAKETMLEILDKYSVVDRNEDNYEFVEVVYKKIVKDFYTSDEDANAYNK